MTMLYRTGAGDLGVAACAASPWGGESSVVPPAFVQTVLPATFVQKKLLPAIFV